MRAEILLPSTEPITLDESKRLIELEKIIEAGRQTFRQTFIEVGTALAEIRDSRLYKSDSKTFEDYCVQKWGFKKSYAYQLIESSTVAKSVSAIADIKTESQAREIAKVPKEQREAVIKTAVAKSKLAGRELTAKDIKIAASPAPAPEAGLNPKCIFPVAMRSQRDAVRWWYSRGTTPKKRGQFFQFILTADKDVEVANKENFSKLVMRWLAEDVIETKGQGHE
jgi:hypothetical protein